MKSEDAQVLGEVNDIFTPIFIVGSPRSGTTWLQQMILSHPDTCGGQESNFFSIFIHALHSVKRNNNNRGVGLKNYLSPEQINNLIRICWEETFSSIYKDNEGKTLIEKTPSHSLFIDDINEVLPKAKFIHIIRDSRAVTASLLAANKDWGGRWAPGSAKNAAYFWNKHVSKAINSNISTDSTKYLQIYYEDLLVDPVKQLRLIFNFINLNCDDTLLEEIINKNSFENFQINKNYTEFSDGKINEPKGFFRSGRADSWKSDLNFFQKVIVWIYTRKLMEKCGYSLKGRE